MRFKYNMIFQALKNMGAVLSAAGAQFSNSKKIFI
jgi:hypothetical protein